MKFNWNEFKNGKVAVHCNTEEKARNFLNKCYEKEIYWSLNNKDLLHWTHYENDTCYNYDSKIYKTIQFAPKCFYENNIIKDYKIIEWEVEKVENEMDIDIIPSAEKSEKMINELKDNKIDYDREYNIMEIMEFPEETIFNTEGYDFKVTNGELRLKDNTGVWILEHLRKGIITSKFKLAKKDKKVSFKEAIQSYGNHIYCIWEDCNGLKKRTYYFIKNKYVQIEGDFIHSMCPEQILNGEWYIKQN